MKKSNVHLRLVALLAVFSAACAQDTSSPTPRSLATPSLAAADKSDDN